MPRLSVGRHAIETNHSQSHAPCETARRERARLQRMICDPLLSFSLADLIDLERDNIPAYAEPVAYSSYRQLQMGLPESVIKSGFIFSPVIFRTKASLRSAESGNFTVSPAAS